MDEKLNTLSDRLRADADWIDGGSHIDADTTNIRSAATELERLRAVLTDIADHSHDEQAIGVARAALRQFD